MRFFLAVIVLATLTGMPASAKDVALLLANARYDNAPGVSDATEILKAQSTLEDAGFNVITGEALALDDAHRRVADAASEMADADRVVIVLAGQIVHSSRDAWWLAKNAEAPTGFDVGAEGLSLWALMDLAAQARGAAVVMAATGNDPIETGMGLQPGAAMTDVPQGVTFLTGPADRLTRLLTSDLLRQGATVRDVLNQSHRDVSVSGYLPTVSLAPAVPRPEGDGSNEAGFWTAVAALDTVDAYRAYVDAYPNGDHLSEAQQRIAAIREEPEREAKSVEEALALDRAERQTIQRNLTILDYDTRGIDGIFGPGTRAAIGKWQASAGLEESGYLDAQQIAKLQAEAEQRARELEAEAERQQAEQERQDRAFWNDVARDGSETDLRAYLKEFPDGLYADVARARLDQIEADKRNSAQAQERQTWENVTDEDTLEAYQNYLEQYPDGAFAEAAKARVDELDSSDRDRADQEAAQQEEERVAGGGLTRLLAEQRLAQLELQPGRVDGNFDADTRAAIRRYQETRGLTVTGYLNEETVVRMLAGQ